MKVELDSGIFSI